MPKKRKFSRYLIGIDTSCNKRYSFLVYGRKDHVNQLKRDIEHICLKNGIKKIHSCEISKKLRRKIYPEILKSALKYKSVCFDVLDHKKPKSWSYKDFYLNFLPKQYSECFDFLKSKDCVVRIDVHDDYGIKGIPDSTDCLMDSLIRKTSRFFAKDDKGIKIRKERSIFYSTVDCKDTGNRLMFNIRKSIRQESNAIIVSDMVLGLYQFNFKTKHKFIPKNRLENKLEEKIRYKKIVP